jgi:hypothetical protein
MTEDLDPKDFPARLTLRDTKVIADEGQRIFTTATGYGYVECEYVRADLASLPAQADGTGEVVKPLEWQERRKETNWCWTAESPFGTYSIVNEDGWYACRDETPRDFYFEWSWQDMSRDTLETAKAAAQTDYETRILSALASPPAPLQEGWVAVPIEPTKEMIEAGRIAANRVFTDLGFTDPDDERIGTQAHNRKCAKACYTAALAARPTGGEGK